MPKLSPISRKELIQKLSSFGYDGPFAGGKHSFMIKGHIRLRIPNPHRGDISVDLLSRILKQADITKEDWVKYSS